MIYEIKNIAQKHKMTRKKSDSVRKKIRRKLDKVLTTTPDSLFQRLMGHSKIP